MSGCFLRTLSLLLECEFTLLVVVLILSCDAKQLVSDRATTTTTTTTTEIGGRRLHTTATVLATFPLILGHVETCGVCTFLISR